MRIMINLEGTDQCREFNILRDITVAQLKNELAKIYKIPSNQMEILLNDYPLQNSQFLSKVGIGNNLLTLRKKSLQSSSYINNNITPNQNRITSSQNLNQSQALLRSNYNNMANINQSQSNININRINNNNPNLSNSFQTNPELLGLSSSAIINDAIAYNNLFGDNNLNNLNNLNNPQNQQYMEDIIQRQRINDNLRKAAEIMPESLVPVHMLYINVEVNKYKTQALIDTGAQSSFISADLCHKCGLFNLMDKRFQGIARGVGASKILGVIHAAEIKILNKIILARVNVIENNEVGFVLGLDNLRKYNCNVDLKKNGLVFPDIGITAKFLSDGEINKIKQEREQLKEDEEIELAKLESLNYV